jgi:glucose/arabinose dehydrogenase
VRENVLGVFIRAAATDPESVSLTYAFGGPDAARFSFNPATRELRFTAQPDFEAPADGGGDNVYSVFFTASDGANTTLQNLAITVADVAPGFRVRRIASGLNAPIFVTGLPDGSGRIAVVQRAGLIRIFNPATGAFEATDFLNLAGQIDTTGEKGLLSIAFSPGFAVDRAFYLHLNPLSANVTEIRRYTVQAANAAVAEAGSGDAILTIPQPSATNHKGGTLVFDPQGRLLVSLGDGGNTPEDSQLASSLRGKILRIDPATDAFPADSSRDYAIPSQNPFSAGGGLPEIYAMGLRNPFRISVDPVSGDAFIGEVGQSTLEEVNRIPASQTTIINFGWSRREGSLPFNGGADSAAFTLPVTEYGRALGGSITGGVVYRGPIEDLQGQYLFADFSSGNLWSAPITSLVVGSVLPATGLTPRNSAFAPDVGTVNSIVNFGTDVEGNVYFVDIGGEIFRLEPLP